MSIRTFSILGYTGWCGLGFLRGIHSYTYQHKKHDTNYFYLDSIGYGVGGAVYYANPLFLPFSVYKEMYRFEVNVRQLEHEKKTDYYHVL